MITDRGGLCCRPVSTLILLLNIIFMVDSTNSNCSHTRTVLKGREGNISDGPHNYTPSSHCEWLIDAGGPKKTIFLKFIKMGTECSYDFLFVYDGNSYKSPRIATLSGDSLPRPVTAYSGYMLLYLFSDRNHVLFGFEAHYEIHDCPLNCSGHGECRNHKCHCNTDYSGIGCELKSCPEDCGPNGVCSIHSEQRGCSCIPGYTGQGCDLAVADPTGEGRWYTVKDELGSTGFPKRTAHTAVYSHDCLWVFGGFDLNSVKDDLLHFCLEQNVWSEVNKPARTPLLAPAGQITKSLTLDSGVFEEQTTAGWSNVDNTSLTWQEDALNDHIYNSKRSKVSSSNSGGHGEVSDWPAARSGHAMDKFGDGFYIFGGRLLDGSRSNELWFFNISSHKWKLCAEKSKIQPFRVHGHTLTTVEDYLYVLGGSNENDLFVDKIYRISAIIPEQWEIVQIWGGVSTPPLLVGHSTVYHAHSGSLFVFGGYKQNSGLFSDRTNAMYRFHLESHYWSRLYGRDSSLASHPWSRAFHSGVLMGQYLVVYGGKTHKHVELEVCYNNEIFFYHLGCHRWVNHTHFTSNATMPGRGRFGHTAVVANGNIMFIIGGYSGQVLGDVIAYKVPSAVADHECTQDSKLCQSVPSEDKDHCESYGKKLRLCQDDPECVFCKKGTKNVGSRSGVCVHRSRVHLCAEQDFHDNSDRCPGICPALHTCGACVSHGNSNSGSKNSGDHDITTHNINTMAGVDLNTSESHVERGRDSNVNRPAGTGSLRRSRYRTYNRECAWCVKEAQCQTLSAPYGTCVSPNETDTGTEGWWGGLSASLRTLHQCQTQDFPAGLHWLKYREGFNDTFPDEVSIVRRLHKTLGYTNTKLIESRFAYKSKFLGFIHPLGVRPRRERNLTLFMTIASGSAELFLSTNASEEHKERLVGFHYTVPAVTKEARRYSGLSVFPNVTRGNKYFLEQITRQKNEKGLNNNVQNTEVKLQWNFIPEGIADEMKYAVISSEFLEPFRRGNCSVNYNCLSCLSDTLCGWCELKRVCVLRNVSADFCRVDASDESQYLITSSVECPHCHKYLQCSACAQDVLCEWYQGNGHCNRRYRHRNPSEVIRDADMCLPPCHHRPNCSECVDRKGVCVWCQNTQSCMPFSDYVTHYLYGQCTSWKDFESPPPKCVTCEENSNCKDCLNQFGCGWCGLEDNPGIGLCVEGDFAGISGNISCGHLLQQKYDRDVLTLFAPSGNVSENLVLTSINGSDDEVEIVQPLPRSIWGYDKCPDIEECLLDLHNCHPNATCINNHKGFDCKCKRGYQGDGHQFCNRTCFEDCLHGRCSGPPHYKCSCDLGWTGPNCDQDCGCNLHSTCEVRGKNTCDRCQHHTTGPNCSRCEAGAWGKPLTSGGCQPCSCNGHADLSRGSCNATSGECYCTDNTEGIHCERCSHGFFGKPRQNGTCYKRCDARTFLTNSYYGATGDYMEPSESRLSKHFIQKRGMNHQKGVKGNTTHCLWIISPSPKVIGVQGKKSLTYVVSVTGDVQCRKNAVYVYDGIPEFISANDSQVGRELGAFCGKNEKQTMTVFATSGLVTIFFEGDLLEKYGAEFKCTYRALACEIGCGENQVCEKGSCVCRKGFFGPACQTPICPNNCSAELGNGRCQNGLCVCKRGFTGAGCDKPALWYLPDIQLISESTLAQPPSLDLLPHFSHGVSDDSEALGPSPRAGHTLTSCGGDLAFLYGGYSPQEGVLDDVWVLNMTNTSWTRIILHGEHLSPGGRYYHSAAYIHVEKMIYVFGGFTRMQGGGFVEPTKTIWKFNILSHVWTKATDPPNWMPALAGHSLTAVGPTLLVVIGGVLVNHSFSDKVFEYNTSRAVMAWTEVKHRQMSGNRPRGLYGHSALYDQFTDTIYLYGGYLQESKRFTNVMFLYEVRQRKWSVLDNENSLTYTHIEPRAFHTSVHLGDFMVIIGGMSAGQLGQDLLLYRFGCGDYIRVNLRDVGQFSHTVSTLGLAAVAKDDDIFIFGGFDNTARSKLLRLRLPIDPCSSVADAHSCGEFESCRLADVKGVSEMNGTVIQRCQTDPEFKRCAQWDHKDGSCEQFTICNTCVTATRNCVWCKDCGTASCVPVNKPCRLQHLNCSYRIDRPSQCSQCSNAGDCSPVMLYKPTADLEHGILRKHFVVEHQCRTFSTCDSCLSQNDYDKQSVVCAWSDMLQECMLETYTPLRCSMRECHYLRKWRQTCPVPCRVYTKCGDCVAVTGCGWCSKQGANGEGFCMEGGITGPTLGATCTTGNITLLIPELLNFGEGRKQEWKPKWAYDACPPENECKNHHHTCDNKSQICIDYESGYACTCKPGYVRTNGNLGPCEPVCHQGCQNGKCVELDVCLCNFGYVGHNCTVECQCNKHSNCLDENHTSVCTKCEHNTQGQYCQECKPMFVGDASNGGNCTPCLEFCHNHTDICTSLDHNQMESFYSKGPGKGQARCQACKHNTQGHHCERCETGYFRIEKSGEDNSRKPCHPCNCHGHSNNCNAKTGESCSCANNTETPTCNNSEDGECWQLQCVKCKEYFSGTPTNGHQCYRSMQCEEHYCFDPITQNECNQSPRPLLKGRTVFFVVQPRFLNVDIRVTIDVIAGKTDIYLSNQKDTFQVFVDKETGMHDIYLDKNYVSGQASVSRRSADSKRDGGPTEADRSEAGEGESIRITDSVPDYLKLKTTDADYYKLSQFESMDAVDEEDTLSEKRRDEEGDRISREKRKALEDEPDGKADNAHVRRKSKSRHGWHRKRKNLWGSGGLFNEIRRTFPDKSPEELMNLLTILKDLERNSDGLGYARGKRRARHRKNPAGKGSKTHELDFDSVYDLAKYRELVKSLSYNSSALIDEKRKQSRRAITVTDSNKSLRHHNFNLRRKGLKRAGGSASSVLSSSSKRRLSERNGKSRAMKMGEIEAGRLDTYITVGRHNSVLVVRNVQFRLVITLPRDQHNLGSSHFYIILRSLQGGGENDSSIRVNQWNQDGGLGGYKAPTQGTLYFRQDQPHIDLFVFFSVFFSCFFLFLAVCVLLWKMKQTLDARRTRQLQEREMECMASRPFAHILVFVEQPADSIINTVDVGGGGDLLPNSFLTGRFGGLTRERSKFGRYQSRVGTNQQHHVITNPNYNIIHTTNRGGSPISAVVTSNSIMALNTFSAPLTVSNPHRPSGQRELGVIPIAIEPTEDGMAGVGTVIFQLPGGAAAPSHLCLGSALTTKISMPTSSHHHSHKSASLRRRTSTTYC